MSVLKFLKDPMYRNALLIMLQSMILSGGGFLFWLLLARIYNQSVIGIGAAYLSAIELITALSMLGFNVALIKYNGDRSIGRFLFSSSILYSGILSMALGAAFAYMFGLGFSFLSILFMATAVAYTVSTLIDSVFISMRSVNLVFKSSVFSLSKLLIPLVLTFGVITIVLSVGFSAMLAILFSVFFIPKEFLLIKFSIIHKVFRFCLYNYLASVLEMFPLQVMPILLSSLVSPIGSANFYFAFMFASMLSMIPKALARSYLANGYTGPQSPRQVIRAAYLIMAPTFLAGLAICYLAFPMIRAEYILAYPSFVILAASAIISVPSIVFSTKANLEGHPKEVFYLYLFICLATMAAIPILLKFGSIGASLCIMAGSVIGFIYSIWRHSS